MPGTAVFGSKGGLTGVLAGRVERGVVAEALRERRTFATTGERLVGLLWMEEGAMQGDDVVVLAGKHVSARYAVFGDAGFSSLEAWDAEGCFFKRNLWAEVGGERSTWRKLRVTWGGARLYDRYKEAIWSGAITIAGEAKVTSIQPFGGLLDVPEELVQQSSDRTVSFATRTSGDFDGVNLLFADNAVPNSITVSGTLEGYVKVGDALKGNPHKAQPEFSLETPWEEALAEGGKSISVAGGADLIVTVEVVPDVQLPIRVEGDLVLEGVKGDQRYATSPSILVSLFGRFNVSFKCLGSSEILPYKILLNSKDLLVQAMLTPRTCRSVYIVGREWSGGKVVTSPLFLEYG